MHAYMSVRMQTQLVYSLNCLFNINWLHLYISLTVVSLFCITHSRRYVLYHSQSSVYSVSLTVVSLFCITHSRQYILYHSLLSVCSVSLTVVSIFCITHCCQSILYHSQSSVCSVSLTVVSLFFITHCRQYHSQSSQSLTVVPVTHSLILCSVNSLSIRPNKVDSLIPVSFLTGINAGGRSLFIIHYHDLMHNFLCTLTS